MPFAVCLRLESNWIAVGTEWRESGEGVAAEMLQSRIRQYTSVYPSMLHRIHCVYESV